MTCIAEKITPELWEKMKDEIGGNFKLAIERRERPVGSEIVGTNRIIHVETGNYMCHSVPMAFGRLGRWFFYVMNGRATCFFMRGSSKPMIEFHSNGEPFASEYPYFQEQITEIFGTVGTRLSMSDRCICVPQFPILTNRIK